MTSQLPKIDEIARIWNERADVIRTFIEVRPQYEQLCGEVAYILEKRMKESAAQYAAISFRAKTLRSFSEKLLRKQYANPLVEITDFAGVRLVYLYKSDRILIEDIIESEFQVIEKVDKVEEQGADKFGYGALHYLVHLGRKSSGARYDDLKGMICELQVRTVLQDAWAIIDHHLSYKQESDVPKVLQRKLNSLSGLFETADDQFDRVKIERAEYKDVVRSKLQNKDKFLDQEINFDTLLEYVAWKFPTKAVSATDGQVSNVVSGTRTAAYTRLFELERLLERTSTAREMINAETPIPFAISEVGVALALAHPQFREEVFFTPEGLSLINKYQHLFAPHSGVS